jgi:hypothetical protein
VFGFLVSFFLGGKLEKQRKAQIFWVGAVFVCLLFIGFFVGGRAFKKKRKKKKTQIFLNLKVISLLSFNKHLGRRRRRRRA